MKKLLTAVVLTGTLMGLSAPVAASAEPVRATTTTVAHVLGSAKTDAKMRAQLHDIAISGWQQVILGANTGKAPNKIPIRSGVPGVSLKVVGSNWSTFKVVATSSFFWNALNKDFTLKHLTATFYNSGRKMTYNF